MKKLLLICLLLAGCGPSPNEVARRTSRGDVVTLRERCDSLDRAGWTWANEQDVTCVAVYLKDIRDDLRKNKE